MKSYAIVLLFMILIALLGFHNKTTKDYDKDIEFYQDSIRQILLVNITIEEENDSLIYINDSLLTLPPKIKTVYREKYIFIEHSDINELDSLIRSDFW